MSEPHNSTLEQNTEEGNKQVVTLGEILESEDQLMEDANAVLGAIDDKKCTYSQGYMKRQALYSCLTCIPEAKTDPGKGAGVCLACCYCCHEGHELVELYTKRNFRCDCGNSKFPNRICNLENSKDDLNNSNCYNQNFSSLYCTCKRPYPDPDDPINDEMIQCIICEDWYHSRHLGIPIPAYSYSEMTCKACVDKHDFLLHYDGLAVSEVISKETSCEVTLVDRQPISTEDPSHLAENDLTDTSTCNKPPTKSEMVSSKFWADVDWRKQLCDCIDCLKMYEEHNVMFLLDPQDTVQVYEEKGKARARELKAKQEEDHMKFLTSLDRVPLMEAIAGYNNLKENLVEYLRKFAENKKVVREEDIHEFFSNFDSKKKQKCDVPYLCH